MKKQYFFAIGLIMAGLTASAQNQVINGGFENWTDANPVNFTEQGTSPIYNDNLTKETTIVHSGSNSARQTSQETTQYVEYSNLIQVTPGHSYTISYWYLDNSPTARTRTWTSWLDSANSSGGALAEPQINGNAANPHTVQTLQDENYSTDSANWVFKTMTQTAPATAAKARVQIRTYRQAAGQSGGFIYYDDISFVDNTIAGVNENTITTVKMFPNPLNGDVLTVLTDSDAPKAITIFDVLGKQVVNTTTSNNTVNVANLTSGVYMVKITQDGKTATKKLVVQ
ncbi:T9SS type A sorting domain-containing protein [Flavobacterium sp. DGU11]|uniref:T9SS type A sorting domain-containing protein n=1 Tax=Flavobacterium arundinis TaxID=3139143 RepID=A0ABU9HX58_9FLAO